MGINKELAENFEFDLIGNGTKHPWRGYISAIDPTVAAPGILIGGSQNVLKKLSGNIGVRPGLKRRGPADDTIAGVISSYEWNTSIGTTRVLRAANGKLQVEYDDGTTIRYFDLLTGLADDEMLFSFTEWYDETNQKDDLIFVNGKQQVNEWGGGVVPLVSGANDAGIIGIIQEPNKVTTGPLVPQLSSGGIGYAIDDVLTVSGGGANATLVVDRISATAGSISSVGVNNAGSNYTVGDTVTVNGGTAGFLALLRVTSVGGGGSVTGLSVVTVGLGYAVGSGIATTVAAQTSGSASGLTVGISAVGTTITGWHFSNNGSGYSLANEVPATGATGTGATISIETVLTGRITTAGPYTLAQLGFAGQSTATDGSFFSAPGSVVVNNATAYSYQNFGDNGFSFVGVSPDPSGIAAGDVAVAPVIVSTDTASGNPFSRVFGAIFTNDFVNVIGNQLYIGCYSARSLFVSAEDNYLDFAVPSFRAPGDPDLFILDSNVRGVTSKTGQKGNAVIFGSQGDSYSVVRQVANFITATGTTAYVYETDIVDKSVSSDLSSPLGQDFITSVGDTILFLDQNNQLRQFGTLRNLATPVYPILSLDVFTELKGRNFAGGQLRAVSDEGDTTIYIVDPIEGIDYMYQIREDVDEVGNLTAERLWQTPMVRGLSRIAVIAGVTYGYSNANPQMYQLWDTDQYSDDGPSDQDGSPIQLPYTDHAVIAYMAGAPRTRKMSYDKLYFEGYMTPGTVLYCNNYFEYQGAYNVLQTVVNNPTGTGMQRKVAKFYSGSSTPVPGENSIGQIPVGDGIIPSNPNNPPKFRAMRRISPTNAFEVALDLTSSDLDCNWEIIQLGLNIVSDNMQPTDIMA